MIARVRKEMQDRLKEIESELASVEALIAERARLEQVLATPPFAVQPDEPRALAGYRPDSAANPPRFDGGGEGRIVAFVPVRARGSIGDRRHARTFADPRVACVARNRW